ncbi:MAG: ABC transporter permease [Myxococcota bacterium]
MIFLAQLAFRNLFRNLRRTVITSVAVTVGVALIILGWGFVEGLDENVLRATKYTSSGDVLLRPDAYPTDGMEFPLEEARTVPPELAAKLDALGPWTARVWFPARLVKGADAIRVRGVGYDAAREDLVFPRGEWHVEGAWPKPEAPEVALGVYLARLLEVKAGDTVVVEARTKAGAINALTYTVAGLVTTSNPAYDNLGMWIPTTQADALLQLSGERTHIASIVDKGDPDAARDALAGHGWTGATLREECKELLEVNDVRRRALLLLVFVIMAIAATGIANTVIMSVYERVREVGTLLAMGMRRAQVRTMFLLEGAVMGVVAGAVGAVVGSAAVKHWERVGIDFSEQAKNMGGATSFSTMLYARFDWPPVFLAFGFGVAVALLASIWPARHAASLHPADSVRAD